MRRVTIAVVSVLVGVATGWFAWLIGGGPTTGLDRVQPVADRLNVTQVKSRARDLELTVDTSSLLASPLFPMTTGPGAVREPSVRLDGLAISPGRRAALLSIDGGPAEWFAVGDRRDDVILRSVGRNRVTIETIFGSQDVVIGATLGAAQPTPPSADAAASIVDTMPPGFRSPQPPASAPNP